MGRGTLSATFAGLVAVLVAASCSSSSSTPPTGRPDGGQVCSMTHEGCPSGFSCVNRNCVPTCTGGAACPEGSYCEGAQPPRDVCAPDAPISCATTQQCPAPLVCFSGLCSALQNTADGGTQSCVQRYPDDFCAPDALCLQFQSATTGSLYQQCAGMPACGKNGECPVGGFGSVCNDLPDGGLLIPGKQRLCLFSYCTSNANCPQAPTPTHCQRASAAIPYGECFVGSTSDPCFTNADCPLVPACVGADGGLDDGGTPGQCSCADGGTPPCACPDGGTVCP